MNTLSKNNIKDFRYCYVKLPVDEKIDKLLDKHFAKRKIKTIKLTKRDKT